MCKKKNEKKPNLTLFTAMWPLFWALRVIGLEMRVLGPKTTCRWLRTFLVLYMSFLVFLLGPYSTYYYMVSRRWSSETVIMTAIVAYYSETFVCIFTYIVTWLRRAQFRTLLLSINDLLTEMDSHEHKTKCSDANNCGEAYGQAFLKDVRKWARLIPFLPYITVIITIMVWVVSMQFHPIYVKTGHFPRYGVEIARHADGAKMHESGNYRTSYVLLVHTFVYIISIFFVALNVVIRAINAINKTAARARMEDNTRRAKTTAIHLVKLHRMSVEVIKRCDQCFGEIVNCIFLGGLISFIFAMRSSNFGREGYFNFDLFSVCSYACYVIYAIIFFAAIVKTKIMTCLGSILFVVHKENKMAGNTKLLTLSAKLELYVEHVKLTRPYITSWGLFPVEKSVAISFAANILTYLLVLYKK